MTILKYALIIALALLAVSYALNAVRGLGARSGPRAVRVQRSAARTSLRFWVCVVVFLLALGVLQAAERDWAQVIVVGLFMAASAPFIWSARRRLVELRD